MTQRQLSSRLTAVVICALVVVAGGGSAFADQNTVDLDCTLHLIYGTNKELLEDHFRIGVDYAKGLVRVYADKPFCCVPLSAYASSSAYVEGDHMVNRATITEETIGWENRTGVGSALIPALNWYTGVVIDRKTGTISATPDYRSGIKSSTGTCTKRSDTNKF